MRLNLRGVVCQCVLGLGVAATLVTSASDQGGNIRSVTFYTVKLDRIGDFYAEITAYNALKAKGGSTEYASVWASLTGPRVFALVFYSNKWADLDASADPKMKEQATDLARISMRITNCTESYHRVIEKVNPDFSLLDSGKMPTMIRVLVTQVRPDKLKDYLELAKNEIVPGIKKSGLKDYSIAQGRFAEPNTVITSVAGFNNWADLDAGLGLEKGIGKEAYQRFLGKLTPLIVSSQFDVYRFRLALSYLPPGHREMRTEEAG
jgi:hypothetical protein